MSTTPKHYTHGNTPAAWTACTIIMVAFLFGTIAVVIGNWPLFWVGGVALAIAGVIAGRVMAMMGYGNPPIAADPDDPNASASTASSSPSSSSPS